MENFTPISSLSGGLLIGLAAALFWLANGRIAGISGIVGNLPSAQHQAISPGASPFLPGLIAGATGAKPHWPDRRSFDSMPRRQSVISAAFWSGSARGSATAAPAVTAYAAWLACHPVRSSPPACSWQPASSRCSSCAMSSETDRMARLISALIAGVLFGLGLTVSHMINPAKVLGFLDITGDWDPSLAFVMLGALIVMAPTYAVSRRLRAPLCAEDFTRPARHAHRSAPDRRRAAVRRRLGTGRLLSRSRPRVDRLRRRANAAVRRRDAGRHGGLHRRQSRSSAISSSSWNRSPTFSERRSTP